MEERTTSELIKTLGEDVDRSHKALIEAINAGAVGDDGSITADYGFFARQLIRAIFAYIEGITFSVKVTAADHCLAHGVDISPPERFFAVDMDHHLDESGRVVEQRAMLRLASNLRFAFALMEKAYKIEPIFDPGKEWWGCLKKSIKVRDRLMHPKRPEDADVTGAEIIDVLKARDGFDQALLQYAQLKTDRR